MLNTHSCGARWGGAGRCHCAGCHETFSSDSAWTRHRRGLACRDPRDAGLVAAEQAGNPLLARSIQNRFAYLDPLNHVQVELLHRYRDGHQDERVRRGIHLSINGIAAGLRNSG